MFLLTPFIKLKKMTEKEKEIQQIVQAVVLSAATGISCSRCLEMIKKGYNYKPVTF